MDTYMCARTHERTHSYAHLSHIQIMIACCRCRAAMGLCPQMNVLFPGLTVSEQLYFFGMIKGTAWNM